MHIKVMKFICIAGLPGSGKTYLGEKMALENPKAVYLDDVFRPDDYTTLTIACRSNHTIIMSAPHFCLPSIREAAEEKLKGLASHAKIEWIFFENHYEQCKRNVERRDDGRLVFGTIDVYKSQYVIPEGADVREVWAPDSEKELSLEEKAKNLFLEQVVKYKKYGEKVYDYRDGQHTGKHYVYRRAQYDHDHSETPLTIFVYGGQLFGVYTQEENDLDEGRYFEYDSYVTYDDSCTEYDEPMLDVDTLDFAHECIGNYGAFDSKEDALKFIAEKEEIHEELT